MLIGGLLNVIGGVVLARRRERRDTRTAVRLLLPELEEIRYGLNNLLDSRAR